MNQKLIIGIPNGSLIDPKRGGLKEILNKARIYCKNLGSNAPAEITNIPWLEVIVQRPQELPWLAAKGYCDVFFCGDDWVKEWELRGYKNKKLIGLGIGKVDIVVATKEGKKYWRIAASEYPFIAKEFLETTFSTKDIQIIRYGEPIKSNYVVIDSAGTTEPKVVYGLADIVIENTQTGTTLKNYGLIKLEKLFSSECSYYINEKVSDRWKIKKAERIAMMLEGVINSTEKDLVTFNVKNEDFEKVLNYIRKNKLFGGEETVVKGEKMSEITLELPTTSREKPLIDIIADLKELGASSIEGIPLSYSVR